MWDQNLALITHAGTFPNSFPNILKTHHFKGTTGQVSACCTRYSILSQVVLKVGSPTILMHHMTIQMCFIVAFKYCSNQSLAV